MTGTSKVIASFLFTTLVLLVPAAYAQDNGGGQDDESKALDATATQWSFQFAYQTMPDYHSDIVNGQPRPPGLDNYVQLRIVAPIPLEKLTLLRD